MCAANKCISVKEVRWKLKNIKRMIFMKWNHKRAHGVVRVDKKIILRNLFLIKRQIPILYMECKCSKCILYYLSNKLMIPIKLDINVL